MADERLQELRDIVAALRAPSFERDGFWHAPREVYATKPRSLLDAAADALEAALTANPWQPIETAPGWVLVPREPTAAMIAAADASMGEWRKTLSRDEAMARSYMPPHGPRKFIASATPAEKHAIRYRAMLAATPPPRDEPLAGEGSREDQNPNPGAAS